MREIPGRPLALANLVFSSFDQTLLYVHRHAAEVYKRERSGRRLTRSRGSYTYRRFQVRPAIYTERRGTEEEKNDKSDSYAGGAVVSEGKNKRL